MSWTGRPAAGGFLSVQLGSRGGTRLRACLRHEMTTFLQVKAIGLRYDARLPFVSMQLPVGMGAADDAIGLVRAYLTGNGPEADRILSETLSQTALAANVAYLAYYTLHRLSDELREAVLDDARRGMRNNALDVYLDLEQSARSETPEG